LFRSACQAALWPKPVPVTIWSAPISPRISPRARGSGDFTSRSLIALSGSGQASFTDSGEGGEAGFGPFTDGRGSWRCIEANKLHAITLDFTTPTAEQPKADIGRLDFDLAYDPASKTIKGTAVLRLVPLGSDPLAPGKGDGRQFEITGQRVEAP
jgi:hypothetical protein